MVDLENIALKDLSSRLRRQARNVEKDGWLSASRLMNNAADVLDELEDRYIIKIPK